MSDARRVLALALALVLVPTAHAGAKEVPAPAASDRRIVVMPLVIDGKLPADVRARLDAGLATGLGDAVSPAAAGTATCSDAACWQARAAELGATHVVRGTIAIQDRDYTVTAELIEGKSGSVLASSSRRCEICGYDEVAETVTDVAGLLRRKLGASSASLPVLAVASTPAGALVTVDGERVGTTPVQLTMPAGPHDVRVTMKGRVARIERVVLVEGVREELALELAPAPDDDGAGRKARGFRIGGGVATALGIAGLGVGIGLAVLDESPIQSRCSGDDKDIEGHCKYRYESLAAGISIAVVGAAALATGIALLVVDRKRTRARRVAVGPGPMGLALHW